MKKTISEYMIIKKIIFLLLIIFMVSYCPILTSGNNSNWWNENWLYRQEINIPINTILLEAKFQPIDIHVKFNSPCWAKNEIEHSVRVVFQSDNSFKELESQIYDLTYLDIEHIIECGLVFLIPQEANGNEIYYMYYDDNEKPLHGYFDHVNVSEDYYYYEPIPGFPFESNYYKIIQDNYIVYGVAQEGHFLGFSTAQQITKFEENTLHVTTPKDAEAFASFDYFYYYDKGIDDFSSTIDRLISKEILIDGNLMVNFRITSGTLKEDFQTTATYRYYYCPTKNKRISAHIKHEALKRTHAYGKSESLGNIAGLQCGRVRSPSIEDLNFGKMFRYFHVFSENNIVHEYKLDPDIEYTPAGITILGNKHDVDLGKKAWASFDNGVTGEAHSIIFDSTDIIVSGSDEENGVQVQALEAASPGILGLEIDLVSFYFGRNSVENKSALDLEVPDDLIIEFTADFFSAETGGYTAVTREAEIFQSLVKIRPSIDEKGAQEEKAEELYTLTAFVHIAPSSPIGAIRSVISGRNISYIVAELHRDDELIATGIGGRVSTKPFAGLDINKLIDKIKFALDIIDLRNSTVFKKIKFMNLYPGRYLIKIFRENPLLGKERKYICFKIIDVDENTETHILCGLEGRLLISVYDQNNIGLENICVCLLENNIVIAEAYTDRNGITSLSAPCKSPTDNYVLKTNYRGVPISEESITLGYVRNLIPLKKTIKLELFDLRIKFVDKWSLPPEIKLKPFLTHEKEKLYKIFGKEINQIFIFPRLILGKYLLKLKHKSFELNEIINVPSDEITFVFPAELNLLINVYDPRGLKLTDKTVFVERGGRSIHQTTKGDSFTRFLLPPGLYLTRIVSNDIEIGRRKINVQDERILNIVTEEESAYPFIVSLVSIGSIFCVSIYFLKRKDFYSFVKLVSTGFLIGAIWLPWWMLQGSSLNFTMNTTARLFLLPTVFVTLTSTPNIVAGEIIPLPNLFITVLETIFVALIIGAIFILMSIALYKQHKNKAGLFSFLFGIIIFIVSILVFYFAISALANLGVGGFYGEGNLDIDIIGEGSREVMYCRWGPGLGFYMLIVSISFLIITLYFEKIKPFH